MRVAIKDSDDSVEYRLLNGAWISEDCEVVRLEFATRGAAFDIQEDFLDALLNAQSSVVPARIM